MDLEHIIRHPEQMDRETLFDLRSLLALYPYHQTARLLLLKNLYLLHDASFDEELRRAALYITDRKTIFNIVEASHYKLKPLSPQNTRTSKEHETSGSRTVALIEKFLESLPTESQQEKLRRQKKPTPADAAVDYVAYLLESEATENAETEPQPAAMKGQELIDNFINKEGGKFELKENPEHLPQIDNEEEPAVDETGEGYFTETLARIYIKQGSYSKALEIIKRLNLNNSKKNAYFADQIRFLEKLIINNNYK